MNYTISKNMNGFVVHDENNINVGGPYASEESAKRRVRDLKRKAALNVSANLANDPPAENKADGDTPWAGVEIDPPHGAGAGAWSGRGGLRNNPHQYHAPAFVKGYSRHRPMGGARTR
jgi:hypothetical protein